MKKILVIATVIFLIKTGSASALPFLGTNLDIDFRDPLWTSAFNQPSYTVGDVTASANSGSRYLYQDTTDGLGILGGERDEIDNTEYLGISFLNPINLRGIGVTDLFAAPDGYGSRGEWGQALIYFADFSPRFEVNFYGNDSNQSNGEQYIDFGGPLANVSTIYFQSYPTVGPGSVNNEFSVAGVNVAPVPEPATMLLFGTGLVGLVGARFRKKKK